MKLGAMMNLISCGNCATVLDANKVGFSSESRKYLEDGSVDENNFTRDGDDYVPFVKSSVCKEKIIKE